MADVLRWMTLSMASGLFTIEQIELIRRLRNSGITKEQVVLAFEQLERLDVELGRTCESSRLMGNQTGLTRIPSLPITHQGESLPPSSSSLEQNNHDNSSLGIMITKIVSMPGSQSNTPSSSNVTPLASKSESFVPSSASQPYKPHSEQSQSFSRPQSSSACSSSSDGVTDNGTAQNGDASPPASSSLASPTSRLPSELTIIPLPTSSNAAVFHSGNENNTNFQQQQQPQQQLMFPQRGGSTDSSGCVPVQCLVNPHDLLQDECVELEDLKKKGDAAILSEIRNFVMRYNIKQTMIAEMTRLSQAYVSRFFRGDIQDMSERTKSTFYMWYLTCKNNPWKLAHLCPNSGVKRMVSETGDLIPLKRERFTFKAAHLAVLERYYEKDPYPDAQTREQIVEECNKAVERPVMQHGGRDLGLGHLSWPRERPLAEREKVTLPVVNNWFNNRRKEAKKQLRQQHAAMAAAAIAVGGLSSQGLPQASLPSMPANCWPSSPSMTNSMTSSMPSAFPNLPPPMSQTDLSGEATESDASGDSGGPYGPEEMMSIELEEEGKSNCIKEELR